MTNFDFESGDGGLSFTSTSPGPDAVGEGGVRPSFDEGHARFASRTRAEPAQGIGAGLLRADACEGYPVRGRSEILNRRIASHEVGHALVGRALGSVIHAVTIIPSGGFSGKCTRSGAPSSLSLRSVDDGPPLTGSEVVDICARLETLTPETGSSRVADAEYIIRAQVSCIELVAGRVAETILHPDLPPLRSEHDHVEAAAFARISAATRSAATDLIRYAEAEAAGLVRENIDIVRALVDALIAVGILDGTEVDMIIGTAMAKRLADVEMRRRQDWQERTESARTFLADQKPSAAR
jgi:hypothetical protein